MTWIGSLWSPEPNLHTGVTSRVQSGGKPYVDQPRILPQFKLGLAMPPEKKVDGLSRERVRDTGF